MVDIPIIVPLAQRASSGDTYVADSASQADVESAIALASAGDTVSVPAGSGTWNTLALNKAIHLVGNGIGSTNITLGTGNSIAKQSGAVTYMRGFTFTRSTGGNGVHGFDITGSWLSAKPVVIEDCDFTVNASGLFQLTVAGGVVFAKCSFDAQLDDSVIRPKIVDTTTANQASTSESWSTNHTIGNADNGEKNIYVEDCYFHGGGNQAMDFDDAARAVVRYSRLVFTSINSHGLATSEVGCRHVEVYNNDLWHAESSGFDNDTTIANTNKCIWNRGGVWVITDNDIDDFAGSFWGANKSELQVDIRAEQDNSGVSYGDFSDGRAWLSAGQGSYPRQHQASVNWSDSEPSNSGYYIDPLYFWNNTGSGVVSGAPKDFGDGGSWGSHTGMFTEDVDYFWDTARPSYTKYTYPHPLRQTTGQAY